VSTPETRIRRYEHGSRVPGWDRAVDLDKDPQEVPDPATTPVPEELRAEIEARMAKYPDRHSAVIPALHAAQRLHGWCSPEALRQVACVLRVTPAYVESIATFYDMFESEPRPLERTDIYVCTNISCSLCGADELYDAMRKAAGDDEAFNVRSFECLGACDMAPIASFNGTYVGPIELDEVDQIFDDLRNGRPVLPEKQVANRATRDREAMGEPAAGAATSGGAGGPDEAIGRPAEARPEATGGPEGGAGGESTAPDRRPEEGGP
jgi:NADH-quinone oxidoreductase subunit E